MTGLPTTSTMNGMAAHGFTASGRADSAPIFRRAMRHSRHVRVLRIAIPLILVLVLGAFTLAYWLDPMRILRLPTEAGSLVISGTKIIMAAPKLSGYTRDSRSYALTAQAAAQDITKPDIVELQGIRAKIDMLDRSTVDLTAADGILSRKSGILTLGRNTLLKSSGGYEVRLNEAVVDTASGNVRSEKPVEVKMQQGTINAQRLEVTNGGEVIRFEGGVVMNLNAGAVMQYGRPGTP
jgi:lipopolysaccharide export system protein LptC